MFLETTEQYLLLYAYSPLRGEFTAIVTDISDRKRAEKALHASEKRLSTAAKAANSGIYSYDFGSSQAYYSPEFVAMYGMPPDAQLELDRDLVPKALYPDDKSDFLSQMTAANDPTG